MEYIISSGETTLVLELGETVARLWDTDAPDHVEELDISTPDARDSAGRFLLETLLDNLVTQVT